MFLRLMTVLKRRAFELYFWQLHYCMMYVTTRIRGREGEPEENKSVAAVSGDGDSENAEKGLGGFLGYWGEEWGGGGEGEGWGAGGR
jgi:hypothetical protein